MDNSSTPRPWHLGLVVVLILMASALRFYHLDAVALRGDEAFTVLHWTIPPFSDGWLSFIGEEAHPVGAFTLYWFWTSIVGTSEFAVRVLPLLANVLGGAATMALAWQISQRWWPVYWVGLLWALNPFLLWHAQDARNYALVTLMAPLAMLSLLRALKHHNASESLHPWRWYILFQSLGIYLYFFEAFSFAVQIVFVWLFLWWQNKQQLLPMMLRVWGIIAALCSPVALQVFYLLFVSDYQGTAVYADFGALFESFIPTLWFGENSLSPVWGILFVAAALAMAYGVRRPWAWLLVIWAFLPLTLLYVVSNWASIFRPRYVIHVVPAFILLLVLYLDVLLRRNKITRPYAPALLLLPVIALSVGSIIEIRDYFVNDPPKAPDWRALTDYLEARTTSRDIVLIGGADPAMEYYYNGAVAFVPPEEAFAEDDYNRLLQNYEAVYVLAGADTAQAGQYFQSNAQWIPGDTYPGVGQYRAWDVQLEEIAVPLDVQFGDLVRLHGYTLLAGEGGGGILLLYWEALRQTDSDYSVLTHVVPASDTPLGSPLVAALDHGVAGSLVSTRAWSIGAVYRDPVPLDQALWGEFQVLVGWYETGNPDQMLGIANESRIADNRFVLPQVIKLD